MKCQIKTDFPNFHYQKKKKKKKKKKKLEEKQFLYKRTAVRTLNLTNANLGQSKEEASFDPKSK